MIRFLLTTLVVISFFLNSNISCAAAAAAAVGGATAGDTRSVPATSASSQPQTLSIPSQFADMMKAICMVSPRETELFKLVNEFSSSNVALKSLIRFAQCIRRLAPSAEQRLNRSLMDFLSGCMEARSSLHDALKKPAEMVKSYLELESIESNVRAGKGWRGRNIITSGIPIELISTVQALVGRIFVVDPRANRVVHTGSGMIFPESGRIVTCKHVMRASNNDDIPKFRRLKFYFVRSVALSPMTHETASSSTVLGNETFETGCMHPDALRSFISDAEVQRFDDEDEKGNKILIRFLQHKAQEPNSNLVREIIAPGGLCGQDGVEICHLRTSFDASILRTPVSVTAGIPEAGEQIYALGFPNSPYLMYKIYHENHTIPEQLLDFWIVQGVAPLTMTSGLCERLGGGGFLNTAPTAEGMSGGPILVFDRGSGTVKIVGVVGQSEILPSPFSIKSIMFSFANLNPVD